MAIPSSSNSSSRPPSLSISTSSPARPLQSARSPSYRQSHSPFRHLHMPSPSTSNPPKLSEKATASEFPLDTKRQSLSPAPTNYSPLPPRSLHQPSPLHHQHFYRVGSSVPAYAPPRRLRLANIIKPWIPLILYVITSLAFVVAIACYRTEVFARLDELSTYLRKDEQFGYAVLFFLIFLTTIPPVPLYSTLTILSGYTFGSTTGFVISYAAALSGALTVFILSRTLLRDTISRWLASTCTIKRVVRAIEKRPKLLFLVRLAPYPYNVMNCLLAASPTLTLRTYTLCTALSLFKVIVHTSLGASIHSFRDYHAVPAGGEESENEGNADWVARMWTGFGIALCIAIFIYLSVVARRAVDEELDGDEDLNAACDTNRDDEERVGFLSTQPMSEVPFRPSLTSPRPDVQRS